jgi:chromosome partitioning protein
MKRIATVNFKGGVGKTTITWLLARYVAERLGRKVLVFDTDPQMSLTYAVEILPTGDPERNFSWWYEECIRKKATILDAIELFEDYRKGRRAKFDFPVTEMIYRFEENLHLVPSVVDLYWIELELIDREVIKTIMPTLLEEITLSSELPEYEVIFFDCPPSFNLLSYSVISCTDLILVPVNPDAYASRGVRILLEGLDLRISPTPMPKIGVFMNRAKLYMGGFTKETERYWGEVQEGPCKELSDQKGFDISPLKTYIPERVDIKRAIPRGVLSPRLEAHFANLWAEIEELLV